MEYLVESGKFSFSYSELKEEYLEYKRMSDKDFISDIPKLLHFTCFVLFLKEIPAHAILCDDGIIHQLIHLINDDTKDGALLELQSIRETFNEICKLA